MQLQQIVERCQQGDSEAIALLYTAMREPLHSVCLNYLKDETAADDLLHDVFLHIFAKIRLLKDTARAEAWMITVAKRVVLQYLRQQKLEKQQQQTYAERPGRPLYEEGHAESMLAVREILDAVDALPEGYRRVFRLSALEGKTHQEIADTLHIEPHSSSSQLYHAKTLLRRWLRPMLLLLAVALPTGLWHWQEAPVLTQQREGELSPVPALEEKEPVAQTLPIGRRATMIRDERKEETVVQEDTSERREATDQKEPMTAERRDPVADEAPTIGQKKEQQQPEPRQRRWSMKLAYSGGTGGNSTMILPQANAETNPTVYDSLSHHHLPLAIALNVNYRLDNHWQLGTGLCYTRQTSDFRSGNTYISLQQRQRVEQLGIPVSLSCYWPLTRRLDIYCSASITLHIPLRARLDSDYLFHDGTTGESSSASLHPGLQWSAGVGAGLQYNLTPSVSFFVEPSLHHYFPSSGNVSTYTTEHPLAPSVPLGLRISF